MLFLTRSLCPFEDKCFLFTLYVYSTTSTFSDFKISHIFIF